MKQSERKTLNEIFEMIWQDAWIVNSKFYAIPRLTSWNLVFSGDNGVTVIYARNVISQIKTIRLDFANKSASIEWI